jgi:hypothetical protein
VRTRHTVPTPGGVGGEGGVPGASPLRTGRVAPEGFEALGVSKLAIWGGSPKRAKNPQKRRISGKTEVANFACCGICLSHNSRTPQKGPFLTLFGPPICKYLQMRGSFLESANVFRSLPNAWQQLPPTTSRYTGLGTRPPGETTHTHLCKRTSARPLGSAPLHPATTDRPKVWRREMRLANLVLVVADFCR